MVTSVLFSYCQFLLVFIDFRRSFLHKSSIHQSPFGTHISASSRFYAIYLKNVNFTFWFHLDFYIFKKCKNIVGINESVIALGDHKKYKNAKIKWSAKLDLFLFLLRRWLKSFQISRHIFFKMSLAVDFEMDPFPP